MKLSFFIETFNIDDYRNNGIIGYALTALVIGIDSVFSFKFIAIALVLAIALIIFLARYIDLDRGNIAFTSPDGTVKINVDYNDTQDDTISPPIPITPTNQTNQTLNEPPNEE